MQRRTKKVVFFTATILTLVTLFATAGRHHRFAERYGCFHQYDKKQGCNEKNHDTLQHSTTHY